MTWTERASARKQPPASQPLGDTTIFLVEDELLIALDLQFMFERAGASVVTAHDLPEALELYGELGPKGIALAFLDIRLPSGEVYPLAERLCADIVPIIFHSGHATAEEIRARFPGAPLLTKPASEKKIIEAAQGAALQTARAGDR